MKPWNRLFNTVLCLFLLSIFTSQAAAQNATLLSTTTFSSGLPSGWSNDGTWYASTHGKGGTNGSMVCNMVTYAYTYTAGYTTPGYYDSYGVYHYPVYHSGYYTYYTDALTAPSVNASDYASTYDSVWVDFDFCWEYNKYDFNNGDDNFEVVANSDALMNVSTSQAKTYSKDSLTYDVDPPTADSNWHHYHLLVPVADRTSSLTIKWIGLPASGSSNPAIDNVTITAYADINLTKRMAFSRSSISLGQVRVGRRHADTLKVTSNGYEGAITINSSGMKTGTLFSSYPTSSSRTIATGSSEIDSAIFSPTSRGTFNDSLIFTTNSDTVPQRRKGVYVSGQGIQAIFNSTNGTTLAFGNVRVGRTMQRTFAFSNSGDDTLFLQTPTITSDSGFSIVSGPASLTVPPSQTRSVVVQFAPATWRSYSGTLSFTASNGVSAPSVTLSGIGSLPQIQVPNFTGLGTERVGQTLQGTVTFTNTGNDTLHFSYPLLMQPSTRFSIGAYDQAVLPGATGTIHIAYAPNQRSLDSMRLRFFTDDPAHLVDTIIVTGQGVQAIFSPANGTTLAYGNLRVGRTAQRTFSFTNSGDDTLFLQTPSITGSGFSIASGPTLTMPPSQTSSVVVQFAPTAKQPYNGTLSFTASNGVTAPTVTLSGNGIVPQIQVSNFTAFGPMRVGQTLQGTVTFKNAGNDTLHISSLSLTQPSTRFTLGAYDQMVLPGNTGTIHIAYSPNLEKLDSATLHFITDDPMFTTVTAIVTGIGALPHMAVANNRTTVDLGQVKVLSSTTRDFAVTNNGFWDLHLTGATATPPPFSIVAWPPVIGGASTTAYVSVAFAPTATGPFSGTLVIAGDDPSNPSDTIFLTGTGIKSALSVDPVNVNFGLVPILSTVIDTIKLSDSGTASVIINSYKLTPNTGAFAILDSSARQVSAGGTALVIVSFRPDTAGSYSGILTLTTDDASTPTRTVNLSGHGVKGALVVIPSSLDFGNVTLGHDSTFRVSLKNTGQASVTINSLLVAGSGFSRGAFATPQAIKVGDSAYVDLTFTPTIAGDATGSVSFTLGDNTAVNAELHGVGVNAADVPEVAVRAWEFALSISPNPASRSVTAHISLAQASDGQIEVFDAAGHEVLHKQLGLLGQGAHDVSLPVESLPSGNYFVRITNASGDAAPGVRAAARFVLQR